MSSTEILDELKKINEKLDKLLDLFEAMQIFYETIEKWAKGEKVDFGGEKDT